MRLVVHPGLTIKAALTLGFGLTLALWLFTGYRFANSVAALEQQSSRIATSYARAQDLLAVTRAQVLSSSGIARDALLDTSADDADPSEAEGALAKIRTLLGQYGLVFHSDGEVSSLNEVRGETERFAAGVTDVLERARSARSPRDARMLMNTVLIPRREALLAMLDQFQASNRAAFIDYQTNIGTIHNASERQTWRSLGWALGLSLGIAVLATLYAGRLEKRLVSQLGVNERTRRSLQHLSTRLINVQEEERRRIARELHDEVGQALTAIKVELAVAERVFDTAGADSTILNSVHAIADRTLQTVRDLSQLLRPPVLDDLGLTPAVDWYLRDFSKRCGIRCELTQQHMATRFEPDVEVAAYRIIQEALTNVARHAHATSCSVTLGYHAGILNIVVEDDGIGCDDPATDVTSDRRGLGLLGMRERAVHFGGAMTVSRVSPHGTRVTIQLRALRQSKAADDWSTSPRALTAVEPFNG